MRPLLFQARTWRPCWASWGRVQVMPSVNLTGWEACWMKRLSMIWRGWPSRPVDWRGEGEWEGGVGAGDIALAGANELEAHALDVLDGNRLAQDGLVAAGDLGGVGLDHLLAGLGGAGGLAVAVLVLEVFDGFDGAHGGRAAAEVGDD